MIVLVTGGREYKNWRELSSVLDRLHAEHGFTYLMHGDARGADQMAHRWAKKAGVQPVAFEALWETKGKKDGSARNGRMLTFCKPALCIAFSGGPGTVNMMRRARDAGIPVIDVEDMPM